MAPALLPIDLSLEVIAVRELAKIQTKKVTHSLKKRELSVDDIHVARLWKLIWSNINITISFFSQKLDLMIWLNYSREGYYRHFKNEPMKSPNTFHSIIIDICYILELYIKACLADFPLDTYFQLVFFCMKIPHKAVRFEVNDPLHVNCPMYPWGRNNWFRTGHH